MSEEEKREVTPAETENQEVVMSSGDEHEENVDPEEEGVDLVVVDRDAVVCNRIFTI